MGACQLVSAGKTELGGQRKAHQLHPSVSGREHYRGMLTRSAEEKKPSQDTETGGFADRPGDLPDPFHTLFGVAGLGLLGEERVKKV